MTTILKAIKSDVIEIQRNNTDIDWEYSSVVEHLSTISRNRYNSQHGDKKDNVYQKPLFYMSQH